MTMPSKDFLTRQAVLNALLDMFPSHLRFMSAGATLRENSWQWEGWSDDCCSVFLGNVREQYAALIAKHQDFSEPLECPDCGDTDCHTNH